MKRLFVLLLCLVMIVCSLSGCGEKSGKDNGKTDIVVTAFVHYDFVKQIVGDSANVTMLIKPGSEIHGYEPTPADVAKISNCDLFVYTGGESDVWVQGILSQAKSEDKAVSFLELCGEEAAHVGEKHNHKDGEHLDDEHVWTSPKKATLFAG